MAHTAARIITLQALTFLHPGTGQSTGIVDLPIQREVYSGHPMYASSGFKGCLRDKAEQKELDQNIITALFGKDTEKNNNKGGGEESNEQRGSIAGALAITDGRILAFPVRSLQQVFVWVTCPMVLNRLLRDAGLVDKKLLTTDLQTPVPPLSENTAWVNSDAGFSSPIVLEELAFTCGRDEKNLQKQTAQLIAIMAGSATGFDPKRLVVIPDQDFTYLVEHATQVSARIKLNEQKTTTGGGGNLWYEETLPPETILYGFVLCHKPRMKDLGIQNAAEVAEQLEKLCADHYLQIGGNETVGQGWCHVNIFGGEKK